MKNPLLQIAICIIIPVGILNRGHHWMTSEQTLVVALLFPVLFLLLELIVDRKLSAVAVLGLLNVATTGSLALLGLGGLWFALKEALFPALVGLFVFFSSFSKNPFIKVLFLNEQLIDVQRLHSRISATGKMAEYDLMLKHLTTLLSLSFGLSSILNFALGLHIFTPLNPTLSAAERGTLLNAQIAQMTSWSFPIIALPSMVVLMALLYYGLAKIEKLSGLTKDEILRK